MFCTDVWHLRLLLTLSLFVSARALQTYALFLASDFLHNHAIRLPSYVCYLLLGSGMVFMSVQRVWRSLFGLNKKQVGSGSARMACDLSGGVQRFCAGPRRDC